MNKFKYKNLNILRILALSGILAVAFYLGHVVAGRIVWRDYNPIIQPISDLTATSAISKPLSSKFLLGYNSFNLLFCTVLLVFFKKYKYINKTFYSGLVLKSLAEILSTFGYMVFPLSDTTWENSFQNTMHYVITAVIVFSYITLSILLVIGLSKNKNYPQMTKFLLGFTIVFIASGFFTVLATQILPCYVGLIERINLYSLMFLNLILSIWMYRLISLQQRISILDQ